MLLVEFINLNHSRLFYLISQNKMSAQRELLLQYDKGYKIGEKDGYYKGYYDGHTDAYTNGFSHGHDRGYTNGLYVGVFIGTMSSLTCSIIYYFTSK